MKSRIPDIKQAGNLEARMQKVSLVISIVALCFMIYGLIDYILSGNTPALLQEGPVLPLRNLVHSQQAYKGMAWMSAGIILLAALPAVRVLLALWLYLKLRKLLDTLTALIVLLELLLSIYIGW